LKWAVVLLVFLAAVLAWATLLEARNGREYAAWYVYASPWFISLLALLGVNILAATVIRFPWSRQQAGFVVTHGGLLVLLGGAIQTFLGGVEGQVTLREGQRTERFQVTSRSVVNAAWDSGGKRSATDFLFTPGPVDWPERRTLDFGTADSLGLKVLRFFRHARHQTDWIADDRDFDGPALQLQVHGPSGNALAEDWLSAGVFGGEAIVGPTRYELLPLPVASMADDFLQPPADLGKSGVLSVHYRGRMQRIPVDGNLAKRIAVGDDGAAVELVEYLADAKPTPKGGFVSISTKARNPLLELKVHLPGREQPWRQVSFALRPLLNLDAVQGETCPVKFWYHHAGLKPVPGAVFAQTPDGKLYCRAEADAVYGPPREVIILTAAAALTTIALILADNCPAVLDASLRPLQPVLRSNFWLVTHVMTITLSYAALALALGIGNITLGYYLMGSDERQTIRSLTEFTYRALQAGVLLLAAGTILGGVWADYSWGRFWGWDPKEVWALVALLGYLAVLHARFVGWVRDFGVAALSVICFSLVVMAWYGVNFVLGAGLHSYGFGGGGAPYVFGAIALQGLFVAAAAVRYVTSGAAAEAERAARQAGNDAAVSSPAAG
jgi:ABC-type transport system involved in cytochrome c biogenesis permease subunit